MLNVGFEFYAFFVFFFGLFKFLDLAPRFTTIAPSFLGSLTLVCCARLPGGAMEWKERSSWAALCNGIHFTSNCIVLFVSRMLWFSRDRPQFLRSLSPPALHRPCNSSPKEEGIHWAVFDWFLTRYPLNRILCFNDTLWYVMILWSVAISAEGSRPSVCWLRNDAFSI